MDVTVLSRVQFAMTIGFHYLFPPWSIGLGVVMVMVEGMYLKTKNPRYRQIAKFWVKIFGLTFAMGVATGLVQVFEFGTNWAAFSRYVGSVFGSALGAEGIFAFLMESGFLAILLFGWNRVSPGFHFFSTVMVAVGAHFSAIWIVIANSWMQTPAGFHIVGEGLDARADITNFWAMIFNPSSLTRLGHVILGCWLAGAFLVISISAFYMLKKRHREFAHGSLKAGLILGGITLVLQLWSADSTARGVVETQPAKLAAMEGLFQTQAYAPLYLFGVPNLEEQRVEGLAIPGLLSFLSYHNAATPVTGLEAIPRDDWPNVLAVFQLYRVMIAMWGLMALTVLLGWIFWRRVRESRFKPILWLMILSSGFPVLANEAGWFTAEMGRQPWVVYNLLRTSDAVSRSITAGNVLGSIIMFGVLYFILFGLFVFLMDRKIKNGPEELEAASLAGGI